MDLKTRIEKMLLEIEVSCRTCELNHTCGYKSHDDDVCIVWEIDHDLAHNLALKVLEDEPVPVHHQ